MYLLFASNNALNDNNISQRDSGLPNCLISLDCSCLDQRDDGTCDSGRATAGLGTVYRRSPSHTDVVSLTNAVGQRGSGRASDCMCSAHATCPTMPSTAQPRARSRPRVASRDPAVSGTTSTPSPSCSSSRASLDAISNPWSSCGATPAAAAVPADAGPPANATPGAAPAAMCVCGRC